ncbi:hypothetical protein EYF80_012230 [Liparis tanakae]|uniref:Uncharacterized protein n=1 Tax=Liparis tanakae TaxID=230148 RepID=A0A4Z2II33_9TELE|nr:hypothetical protein EYF80_012230 [Liparis tanakae]
MARVVGLGSRLSKLTEILEARFLSRGLGSTHHLSYKKALDFHLQEKTTDHTIGPSFFSGAENTLGTKRQVQDKPMKAAEPAVEEAGHQDVRLTVSQLGNNGEELPAGRSIPEKHTHNHHISPILQFAQFASSLIGLVHVYQHDARHHLRVLLDLLQAALPILLGEKVGPLFSSFYDSFHVVLHLLFDFVHLAPQGPHLVLWRWLRSSSSLLGWRRRDYEAH